MRAKMGKGGQGRTMSAGRRATLLIRAKDQRRQDSDDRRASGGKRR
jgi:hypothetical protein